MPNEIASAIGLLPAGWQLRPLREIATQIGSGATPRGGSSVYLNRRVHYALVRSQNVYDRYFNDEGLAFISDADAAVLRGVELQADDVLLNITGDGITFGRSCLVPAHVLPACVNQHVVRIRCDKTKCSPGYLLSFLTHPLAKEYIESFNAGGSRRAITKGHIESFQIPLPPLLEQQAIACILGALDDKIELNRRRNRTLEAMARAIFRSWFVDFDPVKAKAVGDQPRGLKPDLAALFPDSFEDAPLGPIPRGWRVDNLEAVLDLLETGSRPKGGVKDIKSGVPSVGAESIVSIGRFDFLKTKYVSEEFFHNMRKGKVQSRDVLLYKDGGKPGLYEPHATMYGDGFPFDEFCINEHVYRLRAKAPLNQNFLYFWLTSDTAFAEMRVKGTGVAIPGLCQRAH